jgi:hypothetical protein
MQKINSFLFLFIVNLSIYAQDIKMENLVYHKDIKSVQTIVNGIISSVPVVRLNSTDLITFQFDDINEEEDNEFYYKVILCDRDWNASQLDPIEYVDGFNEERLRDWQVSISTAQDYAHYWFSFPNRDTRMKVSGNFVIYVYNKFDGEVPLFTRRFIVAEGAIGADNVWVRPTNTDEIRFKQQMNLKVAVKGVKLLNPQRDVTMTIVQNGNWNESISNITGRNFKDNLFTYDNFGQLCFFGGNESRSFDTRTIRGRGRGVKSIDRSQGFTEISLFPDRRRDQNVYTYNLDFNGNFYVDNVDDFNRLLFAEGSDIATKNKLSAFRNNFAYFDSRNDVWQIKDKEIRSDYVNVIFTLQSEKLDYDVYVISSFTDFQLKPEFKMKYDDNQKSYKCEAVLKQGYYDYLYATADDDGKPNFKWTEGSWQDTENEYKAIVYLREFGARYDRVLGVQTINSIEY